MDVELLRPPSHIKKVFCSAPPTHAGVLLLDDNREFTKFVQLYGPESTDWCLEISVIARV